MGDAYEYPEIRAARFQYAMHWLPANVRDDYGLRDQWINNNLTYLDSLLVSLYCGRGWTDGCLVRPGIEPPSAAVRIGERCQPNFKFAWSCSPLTRAPLPRPVRRPH
eukprot:scaffold2391_cov124-Isochrysis_galbana.AAC.4